MGDTSGQGSLERPHEGRYFSLLEGLRAVAALSVMAVHFDRVLGSGTSELARHVSTTGVAIFFVLSGFLLYRPFSAAIRKRSQRPDTRRFYVRRAARILPAYWLAFAITSVVIGLSNVTGQNVLVYLLLLQDYFDGTRYQGIAPAWSLSIEATFYVLLPLGALALTAIVSAARGVSPVAIERACLFGLVTFAVLIQQGTGAPETILTHLDWFAWGMLGASFAVDRRPLADRTGLVAGAWAGAAVLFVASSDYFVDGVVAALLVGSVALLAPVPISKAVLGTRPVLWLGLISYGIFLWHDPLINGLYDAGIESAAALIPATLALTFAAAALSYYALERPILRAAHKYRPPSPRASQ